LIFGLIIEVVGYRQAATTTSLLPQFAQQCFSFQDKTIHDDTFFVMPEHLHAGGEASSGGWHFSPPGHPHKYYGLSGVASISTINEGRGDTLSVGANPCSKRNHPPIIFYPLGKLLEYHHRRRPAATSHTVPFISSAMLRLGIITDTQHRPERGRYKPSCNMLVPKKMTFPFIS